MVYTPNIRSLYIGGEPSMVPPFSGSLTPPISGDTSAHQKGHFQFTETELFKESQMLTELNLLIRARQHLGQKQLSDSACLAPAYLKLTTAGELEN